MYSPSDHSDASLVLLTPSDASSSTLKSTPNLMNGSMTPATVPGMVPQDISCVPDEPGKKVGRRWRKGHTKSRAGCLNCKRARIKCKENHPACDYCVHRELKCEWPELHINRIGTVIRKPTQIVSIPINPRTPQPVYSSQDFRLFYHFMESAYPNHPLGNASVWTHEVPSIASNYDFLLNAMLALSATDIFSLRTPWDKDLHLKAMSYRVKSIESLNKAVSAGIESSEQGNAMLATCYTLLFQSVMLNEALGDYFAFIRGCVSVAMQMGMMNMNFIFMKAFGDDQLEIIEDDLAIAPLINSDVVTKANRSLEKMGLLCKTKVELTMYSLLLSVARYLFSSSRDAFIEVRKVYAFFSHDMQYDEFRDFTNPANEVCQLLQAHFVAMQLIMTPITRAEWKDRESYKSDEGDGTTGRWLRTLHSTIPVHMLKYYEWTLRVDDEVQRGRLYNGVYD